VAPFACSLKISAKVVGAIPTSSIPPDRQNSAAGYL
jgi:hypothetical protein